MTHNLCDRVTILEERRTEDRRQCDKHSILIESNEEAHAEIVILLLKIKYSMYGGIVFLIMHEVGAIPVIKKIIGL